MTLIKLCYEITLWCLLQVTCEVEKCAKLREKLMTCETELREVKFDCASSKATIAKLQYVFC